MKKVKKMGKTCGKLAIFGEKVLKNCGFRGDVGGIYVTNIVDEKSPKKSAVAKKAANSRWGNR